MRASRTPAAIILFPISFYYITCLCKLQGGRRAAARVMHADDEFWFFRPTACINNRKYDIIRHIIHRNGKKQLGCICLSLHNISRQSAAVCHYGHARLCVMTRGVRAGETFEKVSPAPFQNFKTESLFRDARTKAVCGRKVSSTVAETRCECFGKCEAQTETSYWIAQRFNDPTERRFFLLTFRTMLALFAWSFAVLRSKIAVCNGKEKLYIESLCDSTSHHSLKEKRLKLWFTRIRSDNT